MLLPLLNVSLSDTLKKCTSMSMDPSKFASYGLVNLRCNALSLKAMHFGSWHFQTEGFPRCCPPMCNMHPAVKRLADRMPNKHLFSRTSEPRLFSVVCLFLRSFVQPRSAQQFQPEPWEAYKFTNEAGGKSLTSPLNTASFPWQSTL